MTTRQAATAAAAIILTAVVGIVAGYHVGGTPEAKGLHGPVAELVAFPFVLAAFTGAVILSVVARRRRSQLSRVARRLAFGPFWMICTLLAWWVVANL
jgi:hypothetical protein